jgi:protein involved in polysaccharide export with SLBB domain
MRFITFLIAIMVVLGTKSVHAQTESSLRNGDSIVVKISGVPPEEVTMVSTSYDISDRGTINLPYIGEVRAAGKRPSTLQKDIEVAYKSAQIFTHPTIQVMANKDSQTQMVFVSGEVKTPNRITMTPGMTVSGAIIAAGGPTDFAAMKRVKLVRAGRGVELDCRQADSQGSLTPVQPGDTVVVPQ